MKDGITRIINGTLDASVSEPLCLRVKYCEKMKP